MRKNASSRRPKRSRHPSNPGRQEPRLLTSQRKPILPNRWLRKIRIPVGLNANSSRDFPTLGDGPSPWCCSRAIATPRSSSIICQTPIQTQARGRASSILAATRSPHRSISARCAMSFPSFSGNPDRRGSAVCPIAICRWLVWRTRSMGVFLFAMLIAVRPSVLCRYFCRRRTLP
jgi:hypothetical protein